jgi:hypothetical protein
MKPPLAVVSLIACLLVLWTAFSGAAPSGAPVRIGGTLALTGPLASGAAGRGRSRPFGPAFTNAAWRPRPR